MTGQDLPDRDPTDLHVVSGGNDPLAVRLRRVAEAEHRRGQGEILIENEPNIAAAVAAGVELVHLLVAPRFATHPLVGQLSGSVPVSVVPDDVLGQVFQRTRVPDVFAIAKVPAKKRFRAFEATTGDIVVLDGVEGPGNIGSVIRSATAFEAGGIVALNQHHNDLYRRGVTRATAGTMFALPLVTSKTKDLIRFCRASGTQVVVTSSHGTEDMFEEVLDSPRRLALVLGSEARGCSPEIEEAADLACRIPMSPDVESLNVSVAASVLLFARYRARQGRR